MHPLRLWLAERLYASPRIGRLYARRLVSRARRALRRGDAWGAAVALLHGWKHAGEDALGVTGRALWTDLAGRLRDTDGALVRLAENPHLEGWRASAEGRAIAARFAGYPVADRVRLRLPREGSDPTRVGDLLVLRPHDPERGVKGVLLVTYHAGIETLPLVYDLAALAERYQLVLEPSTWGYMDARFLPYVGRGADVLVQAQHPLDHAFVASLGTNLVPTRVGAGDWVEPERFAPPAGGVRSVDVLMVAAWDPLKRHALLLDALARLARKGRRVTALLVGYAWTWKRAHVERLVRRRGLEGQVTLREKVPYAEMPALYASARLSVLLSRREGANRAIYESWFCDTPTIVTAGHRGVNPDHAASPASRAVVDADLPAAIEALLDAPPPSPRAWALANTGCHVARARVEAALGGPVALRAAGGLLRPEDRARHEAELERLEPLLRRP